MTSTRSIIVAILQLLVVVLCLSSCCVNAKAEKERDDDEVTEPTEVVDEETLSAMAAANTTTTPSTPAYLLVNGTLGTFRMVRDSSSCTSITAILVSDDNRDKRDDDETSNTNKVISEDHCLYLDAESLMTNMVTTARFIDEKDSTETEMELGIGAVEVLGTTPGHSELDMSYVCPPDGYNGFSLQYGSFCEATNNTQLWAIMSTYETKRLHEIRVILAHTYPDVNTLEANSPPFGTAVFTFEGDGLDLLQIEPGQKLALCEIPVEGDDEKEEVVTDTCPELPENSGLNTRLQYTGYGYFGSDLLPKNTIIPGLWIQDDERQLLAGITSPSVNGGLQDLYFNRSGFFLHSYDNVDGANDTCQWFDFCDYQCEVYNYDSRFYDDLGTWRITWKIGQDLFDEQYSIESPTQVRAYMGNAIDAVGVFPAVIYTNVDQTAYLGLDKIGSSDVTKQPGYAYYWYTNYTVSAPDVEDFHPPDVCAEHEDFAFGWMNESPMSVGNTASPSNATSDGKSSQHTSWIITATTSGIIFMNLATSLL